MIVGLTLKNFKGVRSLTARSTPRPRSAAGLAVLQPPPPPVVGPALALGPFQVLVGPNGVGKTTVAVRRFLMQGVRYIQLNSRAMRLPCPATRGTDLDLDGTNMARVVGRLLGTNGQPGPRWAEPGSAVARWVDHLRYALPDLVNIGWDRRQADNAEFLVLRYENGLEAPSWVLSDGTLRMLALTLPAFLPPESALYMVEEPENGVHPKALEIILRSLSAIPGAQMLLATHSPFVVQQCGIGSLLCFSRDEYGTHIITGPNHPVLKDWEGTPDLGIVFAAGLLE